MMDEDGIDLITFRKTMMQDVSISHFIHFAYKTILESYDRDTRLKTGKGAKSHLDFCLFE